MSEMCETDWIFGVPKEWETLNTETKLTRTYWWDLFNQSQLKNQSFVNSVENPVVFNLKGLIQERS